VRSKHMPPAQEILQEEVYILSSTFESAGDAAGTAAALIASETKSLDFPASISVCAFIVVAAGACVLARRRPGDLGPRAPS